MPKNIEYRISNKEPQNVEVDPSTFDILRFKKVA